jgi:hypothetical protein
MFVNFSGRKLGRFQEGGYITLEYRVGHRRGQAYLDKTMNLSKTLTLCFEQPDQAFADKLRRQLEACAVAAAAAAAVASTPAAENGQDE